MSVPVVAGFTTANTSNGTTVTGTVPTEYEEGDLLVLFVASHNGTATTPSGWTLRANAARNAAGLSRLYLFTRTATASESNVVVTIGATGTQVAHMFALRAVDPNAPVNAVSTFYSNGSTNTVKTSPSVTTTRAECLILRAVFDGQTTALSFSWAGATEITDAGGVNGSTRCVITVASGTQAVPGATGTATATNSVNGNWGAITAAIAPPNPGQFFALL